MFDFLKAKKINIFSPVPGKIIDITEVSDPIFADKTMGDGFAVIPETNVVTAPCDGTISLLPDTLHALVLETEGVQILIHIGIDTVKMHGQGFTAHVKLGDMVTKGTPLITFDRDLITKAGYDLTTLVILCNMNEAVKSLKKDLQGANPVLEVTPK
jgi:PTS system glucose-specific IIA component